MAAPKKKDESRQTPAPATDSLGASVDLRPASANDFDFAFCVYSETMKDYSAAYIRWDDKRQKAGLASQLSKAEMSVITVGQADAGWLALRETRSSIKLGHLYIKPQFQNRGVGSIILRRLLSIAADKAKPVELSVLKNNPARRLYERSGFVVVDKDAMKYFMRRPHGV